MHNPEESKEKPSEDNDQIPEEVDSESVLSSEEMEKVTQEADKARENEPKDLTKEIENIKEGMEKEQTPEAILEVLKSAESEGRFVNLSILRLDGQTLDNGNAIPYFTEDGLYLETEDGDAIPMDLNRIKRVE